ncbi:MAG: hypothetical protein HKL90_01880, partial [Elusimicrobia bacterium]|nr:hypothetical protein [Elusimicrobiota bacterium]
TSLQGGLGLGTAADGSLWSVAFNAAGVWLNRADMNGVFLSSAALPGADPGFPWSVAFDAAGNPYAVGGAIAPNGADVLAVYKADPISSAITSSQTFDSGFNNNNLVYATAQASSSSPVWIVGSVQTSGPISWTQAGGRTYELAVWNFNPATGVIALTGTYSRAGFDAATGAALDAAGNLWVSGFSQSPSPLSPNAFDLALWQFAPDGKTLLSGPALRTGALPDVAMNDLAPVYLSSGTAYVASPRALPSGQTNQDMAAFSMSSGTLLAENAWQSNDGSSAFPSAAVTDAAGNLVVAGGYVYQDGSTAAGLWRYGAGNLESAALTDAGGARGATFNNGALWLAVDGSTSPYLDAAETPAGGSFADVEPPRVGTRTKGRSMNIRIPEFFRAPTLQARSSNRRALICSGRRSFEKIARRSSC